MYNREDLVKPFYFPGGSTGVLLVHGFTACPIDMRPLGEQLAEAGFSVYAPLLAGHGQTVEEMKLTNWDDWFRSTSQAMDKMKEVCKKVVAAGHSMGGLIALNLAVLGRLDGLVSINTPVFYMARELLNIEQLEGKSFIIEKPDKTSEISVNREGLPHFSYTGIPAGCIISFDKAVKNTRKQLSKITCPALIIQSLEDRTVDPDSGKVIFDNINSSPKEVIFWENEDHYLPLSAQRFVLGDKIKSFLDRI